jgi:hypothetical protein
MIHLQLLEIFARGGGGGSSGGGEGGILVLGYIVPYYATSTPMKKWGKTAALSIGIPATIIWMALMALVFSPGLAAFEVVAAGFGLFSGYKGLHGKLRGNMKKASADIAQAATLDPSWNPEALKQHISTVFYTYQNDWSTFNTQNIATYTTQDYSYHNYLMLTALHQISRRNIVATPELQSVDFVEVIDNTGDAYDTFTALITAKAVDQLVDTRNNSVLYEDKSQFQEYWRFVKDPSKGWILAGISQITQAATPKTGAVMQFAQTNRLFFSIDWGWLLLPKMGNIFGKSNFKYSDVNNHCIGLLDNKLLVQLYTYVPAKNNTGAAIEYTVAQVAVPNKNYGRIVVEHKKGLSFLKRTPKGLHKLSTEAIDLNKRFHIYAETVEQVTTFELLNPGYMAKVIDTPGKFNIEVYDNTIFIYSLDKKATYDNLFMLLNAAYKELRM